MFHSRNIKRCLIELFAYPRWLAVQMINVSECPHQGYFDRQDRKCWKCIWATECRWINSDYDGEALSKKSTGELIEALDCAVDLVNGHRTHHDRKECDCQTCSWLRDTRYLLKRYKAKKLPREINPPLKGLLQTKPAPEQDGRARNR